MQEQQHASRAARPWWRYGMVWLVIAGPAAVVVAGIVTAVIAFCGADTVVTPPPVPVAGASAFGQQPAMAGRNHAATGTVPAPR